MRILMKCPTRARPGKFLSVLENWLSLANDRTKIGVLVSYDEDDGSMSDYVLSEARRIHPDLVAIKGPFRTKIEACNSDLWTYPPTWDVVLLVSDDMRCIHKGWDTLIRRAMSLQFPDTDGALWFFDGHQKSYNIIECVGRKRYQRFGYLYHPSYKSFFCDLESTDVGLRDKKLFFIETRIFEHEHPYWTKAPYDANYTKSVGWGPQDEQNYHARKAANFPWSSEEPQHH